MKDSFESRSDALYYASILLSHSTEASLQKRAAQAVELAEVLQRWMESGERPDFDGNLDLVYYAANRPVRGDAQPRQNTADEVRRGRLYDGSGGRRYF